MICSARDCDKPAKGIKTVKKPVGDNVSYVTPEKTCKPPSLSTFKTKVQLCQEHLDDPPVFVE